MGNSSTFSDSLPATGPFGRNRHREGDEQRGRREEARRVVKFSVRVDTQPPGTSSPNLNQKKKKSRICGHFEANSVYTKWEMIVMR